MAITYETAGVVEATTASSRNYTLPTGIVAGDLIVIVAAIKPSAANTGDIGPVSGYSEVAPQIFGGGYGATLGVDTGNTLISAWYRVADGTEGTTRSVSFTGQNVAWVWGARLSNATGLWDVAGATGQDTSAGSVSVAFTSDPGVAGGDYILAALCIPTDVTTPSQFSAEALSQTGVTFGTVTEVAEPDSSGGNDIGGFIIRAPVSSGTSTAVPTMTATAGGTTTNVRGPAILIRAREVSSGGPTVVAVGQASEADTAQPLGRVKLRAAGQPSEVDVAQPVGRVKRRAAGQTVEADTALPVGRVKRRTLGQAVESDAALPVTSVVTTTVAVGQAAESDAAQPLARRKVRGVGQPLEVDAAQPVGRRKVRAVGVASEVDAAQPVVRRKARTVGQIVETDAALGVARVKRRTLGVAVESDVAQPVARRKVRVLGLAAQTDLALPVADGSATTVPVGQPLEVDVALPVTRRKVRPVATAVEVDVALPMLRRKLRGVGAAVESSTALQVTRVRVRAVGAAVEVDDALPVVGQLVPAAPTTPAQMVGASVAGPSIRSGDWTQTGPVAVASPAPVATMTSLSTASSSAV